MSSHFRSLPLFKMTSLPEYHSNLRKQVLDLQAGKVNTMQGRNQCIREIAQAISDRHRKWKERRACNEYVEEVSPYET